MLATTLTIRRRTIPVLAVLALTAGLLLATPGQPANATHVSSNDTAYGLCDRVFPDPHAYWPAPAPPTGQSPFAKGTIVPNALCKSTAFLTYQEMIDGATYLESQFPEFIDFIELEEDFGGNDNCAASTSNEDYCSAGLPETGGTRERVDLFMIRVTDERSATDSPGNLPLNDKKFFAFPLSIHGIERAGAEGGTRAAEDLATWAYCEAVANGETVPTAPSALPNAPNCAQEGTPHPLLEAQSDTPVPGENLSAGQALKQSVVYFIYANPDGWRRGEGLPGFYQRYNGNGVDMNRDWPNIGFTFKPYTPWSEPETKGFGEVLQQIRPEWDGGIDLHGQLVDRAFSFTLLGALPNGDFSQNQRILQTTRGAWEDAEGRLGWSPHIKPNDAPPQPNDPRMYGVQWGTVWDTIDYTVTGAFGDWIASPIGLGADGIDNEMSFSHLSNCGTGTCYEPVFEQMHIDGNKSLVYAMINYTLLPEDNQFEAPGKVGYVLDPTRIQDAGTSGSPVPGQGQGLPTQTDILNQTLDPTNDFTFPFTVEGPESTPAVYNGGLVGTATPNFNINAVGGASLVSLVLERYRPVEENPDIPTEDAGCAGEDDRWEEVNRYFNQASTYLQAGEAVHTNSPTPGQWRICVTGDVITNILASGGFDLDIDFTVEEAFHLPPGGQAPYDVSNMDFFDDLKNNMDPGQLVGVPADSILTGDTSLDQFNTLVIADNPFPGYVEQPKTGPAQTDPNSPYSNPGAATAACAYQRGTTDVPPGSNNPTPGCAAEIPITIDPAANNQKWVVSLDTSQEGLNDWDLYVDIQDPDTGNWIEAGRSAGSTGDETVTLFTPPPGDYRILVVNWSGTASSFPQTLTVTFDNTPVGPPPPPSTRSPADVANWKSRLRAFVEGGGNLVLTDGAILNLDLLDIVDRPAISEFSVYAGFIGFTDDGGNTDTYSDPLAANVNQPGAAEGPQHRHQVYEPVPIGYAIQDEGGGDLNSAPVWSVNQGAWEGAGGRTAGTTGPTQVTLGELALGQGRVRIIGPLLPMPTEQYYHPFGLASYALTYSGYQVFNNALQWNRGTAGGGAGTGTGVVVIPKDCSRLKKLSGYNIVIGTQGNDKMIGTSGKDGLCGRKGKDKIRGLGDNDVLIGGKHNDKIVGAAGNDQLFAGAGNDRLSGGAGKDRLVGHKGNDRLAGGGGRDIHRSGAGKDACRGGPGKDKFQGCEQQA